MSLYSGLPLAPIIFCDVHYNDNPNYEIIIEVQSLRGSVFAKMLVDTRTFRRVVSVDTRDNAELNSRRSFVRNGNKSTARGKNGERRFIFIASPSIRLTRFSVSKRWRRSVLTVRAPSCKRKDSARAWQVRQSSVASASWLQIRVTGIKSTYYYYCVKDNCFFYMLLRDEAEKRNKKHPFPSGRRRSILISTDYESRLRKSAGKSLSDSGENKETKERRASQFFGKRNLARKILSVM